MKELKERISENGIEYRLIGDTCVPHPISTCLEQYAVIYGAKELWINDCHLVWTIRTPCGMYGT